jgi:uncharacterized protein (DUF983 family)
MGAEISMKRKSITSIIKFIWTVAILSTSLTLKDKYDLNFWIYFCVTVPLMVAGDMLIEKLIKSNN